MSDININYITNYEYHRNGVCGIGFHVIDFTWSDADFCEKSRAIVFDNGDEKPTHYAVTTSDPQEKWRGDHFIDLLWPKIQRLSEEKWQATLARISNKAT